MHFLFLNKDLQVLRAHKGQQAPLGQEEDQQVLKGFKESKENQDQTDQQVLKGFKEFKENQDQTDQQVPKGFKESKENQGLKEI
ncbi:hypothetical protein COK42_25185 [Bacillus cereus]|nr:hypothetical protein COK42_25185 [Bacillus cereus]